MKKLKDVIYLKSDAIVLNKDQIDPFENLIGDINDQLEKKGISLCYCYDKLKNNKAKIHGWDLRPKPQASSSKHQAWQMVKDNIGYHLLIERKIWK